MTINPGDWIVYFDYFHYVASEVTKVAPQTAITKWPATERPHRVMLDKVLFCGTEKQADAIAFQLAASLAQEFDEKLAAETAHRQRVVQITTAAQESKP